ncbi:MAG: 30S ribosomal protein S5 [Planctomycetes bacterium]|nr:30S ribosomal protein S5 [Planctomycetota bacterium]
MARHEFRDLVSPEGLTLTETVVKINRCAAVVKGGRRFSFSCLVTVGDQAGVVGFGFGKAKQVPNAVEKSVKDGRKRLVRIPMVGTSIPHEVMGRYGASRVMLIPAAPGTGVIAGSAVRAVLESAGIRDILTKAYGSNNPINLVQATFDGLAQLRTRRMTEKLRGVKIR